MSEDGKTGEARVDLHRDFYPGEAVRAAAAAFSRLAEITIEERLPYHRVILRAADAASLERTRHEFVNYVLAAGISGPVNPT